MPLNTLSRSILAIVVVWLALALSPWASSLAQPAAFMVTNLNDSGAGSLRQAIISANASAAADVIAFAASTNGGTIVLVSPLPALANTSALEIAGNGATRTIVSGNNAVPVFAVAAGATVRISGLTITGGAAGAGTGGGISNSGALTVVSSAIRANSATDGGGIYNTTGSTLTLINSAVSANSATVGGGIFSFGSTATLINSTLNANQAATGGGIFNNNATTTLQNSIIANSLSGGNDCVRSGGTLSAQNSLVEDGTCGVANGVNGNLTGDPALNADLTLTIGSIAVDAGLNGLVPAGITTDLAGNARIQGASVDMGAFEFAIGAPLPTPITPSPPTVGPYPAPPSPTAGTAPTPSPTAAPKPRATATPRGRITGTVIDLTTGAPVPGVAVQVGDSVVVTDANGNYDRNGLAARDYPVQLQLTAAQGEPAQGVIVVTLGAGETVVLHLALRSPLPDSAAPAEPVAIPAAAAPPAPANEAAPVPAALPRTAGTDGLEILFALIGLGLIVLGLRLVGRYL